MILAWIHPQNPDLLYAAGEELLYRTLDSGQSWQPILHASEVPSPRVPGSSEATGRLAALAISPADPSVVYAVVTGTPWPETQIGGNSSFALVRSTDNGSSWQVMQSDSYGGNPCFWHVDLFQAHPTDPQRLFLARSCRHGAVFGSRLEESTDQATTFGEIDYIAGSVHSSRQGAPTGYPALLVGGQGANPARWYMAVNRDIRVGGSTLLRSDDDART